MIHQKYKGIVAKVEVKHADGTSTIYEPCNNLIHNAGLDFIGTGTAATATGFCRASTNTDEPLVTDTSLANTLGSASGAGTMVPTNSGGTPEWFYQMERVYTFAIGAVVGNVSKFGFFSAATGGTMFSSALTKDPVGDPTPIPVGASDQLFVTWQLRKYISITPVTGSIDISFDGAPTSVSYEIKPANLGSTSPQYYFSAPSSAAPSAAAYLYESQALGGVTGAPVGSGLTIPAVLSSYQAGSYYRDMTFNAGTSQGNFSTGIGAATYGGSGLATNGYQVSFTPKLPKDADSTLSLPFRLSWGRA